MLTQLSLHTFLDKLAEGVASPGGGSAGGLAGAQGAALLSMVCGLTIGRAQFADVEAELAAIRQQTEALRAELTTLIEADAAAYDAVMAAYRLPKDTAEAKAARTVAIQDALKQATLTPLRTVAACASTIELGPAVLGKGNPNAISDAASGVFSAYAGLLIAAASVRINLASLKDAAFVAQIEAELNQHLAGAGAAYTQARAIIATQLGV